MSGGDEPMSFHDWADLFGWSGTAAPLEHASWTGATRAKLMASWQLHKMTECKVCDEADRKENLRILEHARGNASAALGLLAAATISDRVPVELRNQFVRTTLSQNRQDEAP